MEIGANVDTNKEALMDTNEVDINKEALMDTNKVDINKEALMDTNKEKADTSVVYRRRVKDTDGTPLSRKSQKHSKSVISDGPTTTCTIPIAKVQSVTEKYRVSMERLEFLVNKVGPGICAYIPRWEYLYSIAKTYPITSYRVGKLMNLNHDVKFSSEIADMMRRTHPSVYDNDMYGRSIHDHDMLTFVQSHALLNGNLRLARGISQTLLTLIPDGKFMGLLKQSPMEEAKWLISTTSQFKCGGKVLWNAAKMFALCCDSERADIVLWVLGDEGSKLTAQSKATHLFPISIRFPVAVFEFAWRHLANKLDQRTRYAVCKQAALGRGLPGSMHEDFYRSVLKCIDPEMIGYDDYVAILQNLANEAAIKAIDGLFPRCFEIAKHDYSILEYGWGLRNQASTRWILSRSGLNFGHHKATTKEEKLRWKKLKKRLVFIATCHGNKGSVSLLIKKKFEPCASVVNIRDEICHQLAVGPPNDMAHLALTLFDHDPRVIIEAVRKMLEKVPLRSRCFGDWVDANLDKIIEDWEAMKTKKT
jgi:hypothetical protein